MYQIKIIKIIQCLGSHAGVIGVGLGIGIGIIIGTGIGIGILVFVYCLWYISQTVWHSCKGSSGVLEPHGLAAPHVPLHGRLRFAY